MGSSESKRSLDWSGEKHFYQLSAELAEYQAVPEPIKTVESIASRAVRVRKTVPSNVE